jgi:hypothetical protein
MDQDFWLGKSNDSFCHFEEKNQHMKLAVWMSEVGGFE